MSVRPEAPRSSRQFAQRTCYQAVCSDILLCSATTKGHPHCHKNNRPTCTTLPEGWKRVEQSSLTDRWRARLARLNAPG